jgi:cobalamin biosynthesis Mg chelatase CobN
VNAIRSGVYEFDSATNKKLALQVAGSSSANGAAAVIGADGNSTIQRWYYDAAARTFTNLNSGKVLALKGGATSSGTALVQTSYTGANTQKWSFVYLGGGRFTLVSAANASLVLTANGTTANAATSATASTGAASQKWVIREDASARTSYIDLPFTLEQMARAAMGALPFSTHTSLRRCSTALCLRGQAT